MVNSIFSGPFDSENEIAQIVEILNKGGLVILPTDTVWGISCVHDNKDALERLISLKGRPDTEGFILLVDSIEMLKKYSPRIHPRVETLLQYHKQPLTLISSAGPDVHHLVTASDGTVAIRVCTDPYCLEIISRLGKPIVSTTANKIGQNVPASFHQLDSFWIENSDFVSYHRRGEQIKNVPSVMAKFDESGELEFIR